MKIVYNGDTLVQKLVNSKLPEHGVMYKWSMFSVFYPYMGNTYLYNNFTKKCLQLEEKENHLTGQEKFSFEDIENSQFLKQLVNYQFLVPENRDEVKVYESFCALARAMTTKKRGYTSYTILPTTACNARCVYCFEQGIKYVTMTEETVDQTIRFIKETRSPGKELILQWFGGEPLMGEKIIDKICNALRKEGIAFKSWMITNGSLITENIIKKMRDVWNLKFIQITLDGDETEYISRKNYVINNASSYWHVLSRIKMANELDATLSIRVNMDAENVDTLSTMLSDLKPFIIHPEKIFFDIAPLYSLQASSDGLEVWEKSFKFSEEVEKAGLRVSPHYKIKSACHTHCMADMPYETVSIMPDGTLHACCEYADAFEPLGDIWKGVGNKDLQKSLYSVEHAQEKCRNCSCLPQCTTFSRCPNHREDCMYVNKRRMERALEKLIRRYIDNKPEETEVNGNTLMN